MDSLEVTNVPSPPVSPRTWLLCLLCAVTWSCPINHTLTQREPDQPTDDFHCQGLGCLRNASLSR